MRILFVESGSGFGGSATCLANLVQELDKRRFLPIVAHHAEGPGIERIARAGIPVTRLHRGRAWFELVRFIRRERIDIVHANNELYSHLSTILAARFARRPCLMHMRGIRKLTRMEHWLAKKIRHFIVISEAARKFYTQDGLAQASMTTIYDGIDLTRFQDSTAGAHVRRELGFSDAHIVIGIVSRLVPKKGQREFLEALAILARDYPQVRGLVVGGDPQPGEPYRLELEEKAKALGLSDRVVFAGWRDDVAQVNAALDIAVQATQYVEGLCAAVAEAMAAGRPVVASNVGGIPELVVAQKTGTLVAPGSVAELAAALQALVVDEKLRSQMGRAGRERIASILDQRRTVRQVEQIYQQLQGAEN